MTEFWKTAPYNPLPVRQKHHPFSVHDGKHIIVTGAAGGIGSATVELLVSEGAYVAAWDLRLEPLEALARKLGADKVFPVVCDLGDQYSVAAAVDNTFQNFGRIDGLVNNAATVRRKDPLDSSWSDWLETMAVNVCGAYEAARLVVRLMIDTGTRGAIVNVASEAGKKGHTGSITYSASKAAMISMTRVLSVAVAPHDINVNCICPGGVATEMLHAAAANYARLTNGNAEEIFPQLTSSQLRRHIVPDEVARTISFLLSDDAMIIRGQAVNTDAGDTPY